MTGKAGLPSGPAHAASRGAVARNGATAALGNGSTNREDRIEREPVQAKRDQSFAGLSAHDAARRRRAQFASVGRTGTPARPTARRRPEPPGLAAVDAGTANSPATVRAAQRAQVTGEPPAIERREAAPKVGFARTPGGLTVSGTLVRSAVRVTGDEAGASIAITGESDQRAADDLTARNTYHGPSGAVGWNAHGASVFGTFVAGARLARPTLAVPFESSVNGNPITGSAVGRSVRVTGNEAGACRAVTGAQYAASEREQTFCGGRTGGGAPATAFAESRRDPVTGAKVVLGRTRGGRLVSGIDVELNAQVTGDARGVTAGVSGSQYTSAPIDQRSPSDVAVTGDVPVHSGGVSGTQRGALRDVTGTAYYANDDAREMPANRLALIDERFSIHSPQRSAHLRAAGRDGDAGGITGSFAAGGDKLTGNREFAYQPRTSGRDDAARLRVTGEGRLRKGRFTGDAWSEHGAVTGTEGEFSGGRNPSLRAGKQHAFAGAGRFKTIAAREQPAADSSANGKQLVTGTFGFSSESGARVTLSGGGRG